MAEPARQLDDEPDQSIYDESGTVPSNPKPDLKALEGGGETTEPRRGHLKDADTGHPSRDRLSAAEEGAPSNISRQEDQVGRGYKPGSRSQPIWKSFVQNRKRAWLIGGGISAILAGASIAIFLALLPLKILHIVNNLQNRFYAASQNAIQNQTDSLFKRYVIRDVLPSYKSCGTTISKNCSVKVVGTNPVTNLYKTWGNARLENKLATDYGIEFQHRPDGWYLKTPSTGSAGISIGESGEKLDSAFQKVGISDIRSAISDETRWYQVYLRFKVGRLLEEKYGIRRCLIFCSVTDPLAQKVADQKIASKLFLAQRVLVPRTQTLGIAIECLLLGDQCTGLNYQPTDATPGVDAAEAGAPEDAATDTAIRQGLVKLAASYGVTDAASIDALVSTYEDISAKGFQNYIITEGLAKLPFISQDAAAGAADKVPFIGWIDLFTRLIGAADNSSASLKKLSYVTNATAAVALFSMYRTYADEVKTGHANAQEVGSLTASLNPGNTGSSSDSEVGGNVGAEGTPLYESLIDGNNASSTSTAYSGSSLASLLSAKALAATTSASSTPSNSYLCNNGNPVPTGKLVCSEEVLGAGNHYADLVHDFLNLPGVNAFTNLASLWRATIGQAFNIANDIFGPIIQGIITAANATCSLPLVEWSPYCSAKSLATQYLPRVEQAVVQWLIPDPFGSNMSGGRTFDMMAAGADVSGNDAAHTTLGGEQLTSKQAANIVNEQGAQELQDYQSESFFARMFDTNSNYSPVTKLAMAIPTSWSSASQSVASLFTDPVDKLGHSLSSIFSPAKAIAATPAQSDPFGVVQYGYPAGTIPDDPEAYWDQNCSDNAAYAYRKDNSWNETAASTPDSNEMPLNTSVNPCLLIMATTGSDGAIFPGGTSLLTADDLSGQ